MDWEPPDGNDFWEDMAQTLTISRFNEKMMARVAKEFRDASGNAPDKPAVMSRAEQIFGMNMALSNRKIYRDGTSPLKA